MMENKKNFTNNQHYVPQVYLRQFATKKKNNYYVKVIDKKMNKRYESNIENVANETKFYEVEDKERNYWENYYCREIESSMPNIFNFLNISSNMCLNYSNVLNDERKIKLSKIIISQITRTKKAKEYFDNICTNISHEIIKKIKDDFEDKLTHEQNKVLEKYYENSDFNRAISLERMNSKKFIALATNYLLKRSWVIYKNLNSEKNPFITSDHPISYYNVISKKNNFSENGLARKDTIIEYPLNKELILVLYPENYLFDHMLKYNNKIIHVKDDNYVRKINKRQMSQSYRYAFSSQ